MTGPEARDQGRAAFGRRAWADACAMLSAADAEAGLEPADLELLAVAAHLVGRDDDCVAALGRAYHALAPDRPEKAARCAFWLALNLLDRGESAQARGWLARAQHILEESSPDCAERGFLILPTALQSLGGSDATRARELFNQALAIGRRSHDVDLITLGLLGSGQSMIELGEITDGLASLDEAMVAVTAGEVSPLITGLVYCAVIDACQTAFDVRRAREWTTALSHWCDSQPDLVPYRGQCLVHRAQIMQLQGAWPDALAEADLACRLLSDPPGQPAVGAAYYQQAELHRLHGSFRVADNAYRQAGEWGHDPQPGLARLRLAQGQVDAAAAGLRRALAEAPNRTVSPRLLAAYVDVMLAANDVDAARSATQKLSVVAASSGDVPVLAAIACRADAAVRLAEHDPGGALPLARRAWRIWRDVDAPYEAAQARVLVALACRELGDHDAADMELEAAGHTFRDLGAAPDLDRVARFSQGSAARSRAGLTPRELEVLRLLAAGRTNRSIASELVLSEKTVARHVSNIFTKLDLSSRAAATAYAYEHQLV